jgi:hypothetical protein
MKQPYFDRHGDLARCSAAQQIRVWGVWSLIHARRPQNLGARPRWRELAICWLLHHASDGVSWLAKIRRRLRRRLG